MSTGIIVDATPFLSIIYNGSYTCTGDKEE